MASQKKVCPYIDMPLQHASEKMLALMKRGGGSNQYRRMIDNIRKTVPDVGLRTTFIVGYPGETDEDFQILLDFVSEVEFDRMGVFLYSDEEGTTGFDHTPKIPHRIAAQRRRQLMTLQAGISKKRNRALIGRNFLVIVDGADSSGLLARLYHQAPDVDGVVKIKETEAVAGDLLLVEITGAGEYDLTARLID